MKHTTGPWIAIPRNIEGKILILSPDRPSKRKRVAQVDARNNWDEQQANANLIAAAPELLEALKLFSKQWEDFQHGDVGAAYEKAKQAIAKAEGKQNQ